ncbi:MAG: transketolase [Proteobacteria bacterium]|nr:transketolase [Pseudomonadota bacterium]
MENAHTAPFQGPFQKIDTLCINTIRTLSIDAIQKANSGHPGLPLGAAPFAYVLFQKHLKFNPANPDFFDRDRFVLSAGHGSMLIYSLLHLYGYDLSMDEIKNFRQLGSKTPGHPEFGHTRGVEATTGPLGQGTANAVGMAIAERKLANLYNTPGHTIVDHHTWCLVGDGDLMEGISTEAASLAGHLKLGKLIYLYDSNDISLDGPTSLSFTEDVAKRYESYGFQVITVKNADTDLAAIDRAMTDAKNDTSRPSLIILKTTIGYGSPNKAGKSSVHGSPLGPDELSLTKKSLGWEHAEPFFVPEEARAHFALAGKCGAAAETAWNGHFEAWSRENPAKRAQFDQGATLSLPVDFEQKVANFKPGEDFATRESAGKVLNSIASALPHFFGGDADLSCSTNTLIKEGGSFEGANGSGRNIHYGVREHGMGAIANGIAYHGGLRTFTATFFCFADYMKPAIRLAAMNHLPVTFVFTHDSIGLGEDGPTHQPVEHLMSLRGIPNLVTLRPADAFEARESWTFAMEHKTGPVAIVLSRQKLKTLESAGTHAKEGLRHGAYVISDRPGFKGILVATGSEVGLALDTQKLLDERGVSVRVVSMPSLELYLKQKHEVQEKVLPTSTKKIASIEAGITLGWAQITGREGLQFGVNEYGTSAPAGKIYEKFGLTAPKIAEKIAAWIK